MQKIIKCHDDIIFFISCILYKTLEINQLKKNIEAFLR